MTTHRLQEADDIQLEILRHDSAVSDVNKSETDSTKLHDGNRASDVSVQQQREELLASQPEQQGLDDHEQRRQEGQHQLGQCRLSTISDEHRLTQG